MLVVHSVPGAGAPGLRTFQRTRLARWSKVPGGTRGTLAVAIENEPFLACTRGATRRHVPCACGMLWTRGVACHALCRVDQDVRRGTHRACSRRLLVNGEEPFSTHAPPLLLCCRAVGARSARLGNGPAYNALHEEPFDARRAQRLEEIRGLCEGLVPSIATVGIAQAPFGAIMRSGGTHSAVSTKGADVAIRPGPPALASTGFEVDAAHHFAVGTTITCALHAIHGVAVGNAHPLGGGVALVA